MRKDLVSEKEEIKYTKMINFDDVTREILIVRGSVSGKTNKLFNLTSQ